MERERRILKDSISPMCSFCPIAPLIIKERLFSREDSVFGDLFEQLQSPLEKRLFYCVIGGLVLALAIHGFGRNSMNGLTTVDLYYSAFIAVVCILGGCIVDEVFFLIFDNF